MADGQAAARPSIFISGAASGIGLATARHFAAQGWFVGLADIDAKGLEAALAEIGPENGVVLNLDVRDRAQWAAALAKFWDAAGQRLDVLLNNAGVARYGRFEDVTPEESDQIVSVNIGGVINGAYQGLEWLKQTPGARLINVASCAALYGVPHLAVYSATKFAVKGLSEALDVEFERHGIRVSCILPWFIETPILDSGAQKTNASIRSSLEGQPIYTAEAAAEVIWKAAHGRKLHYTVGERAGVLKVIAKLAPGSVIRTQLKAQTES